MQLFEVLVIFMLVFWSVLFTVCNFIPFFLLAFSFPFKRRAGRSKPFLPCVTIIVPARNEEKVIRKCLYSLVAQDYPKQKLQLLVVDDGSQDATPLIVKEYSSKGVKLLIRKPKKGSTKAAALNHARKFVRGEIVGIVDADSYLESKYVKKCVKNFVEEKVGAVVGFVKSSNANHNWLTKACSLWIQFTCFFEWLLNQCGASSRWFGGVCFVRRSILERINWFKTQNICEDFYMSLQLLRLGYKVRIDNSLLSWNEEPKKLSHFLKQRERAFQGGLQSIKSLRKYKKTKKSSKLTLLARIIHLPSYWIPASFFVLFGIGVVTYFFKIFLLTFICLAGMAASLVFLALPGILFKKFRNKLWFYLPITCFLQFLSIFFILPLAFFKELTKSKTYFYRTPR